MKKTLLTLVFAAILSTLSFAQTVQKTYYFETPTVSQVNGYDVLKFADTYNNGITGEASLPWQTVSLLLPQNTDAQNITVEYSDFVELEGSYNLMPAQKPRPLSSTEPLVFEKNEDFYRSEKTYPETTYSKANTQYLNGCSFAFARFSPVRYVPATGKVSYAKSVTVTVDVTASKSDRSNKLWMTPEVQARVERLAQNPEAVKAYKNRARTINGYELLVITPQEWVSHFDEYVAFYEARGLRTHVTALEDILANYDGRDNAEKMRTYIAQEYENEGIMMVLLGGDSNVVPWRALYCNVWDSEVDNLPADMYFVCLDGTWNDDNDELWGEVGEDDLLPELAVGRMPFNNETQFNNMMHKTLEYQANPVLGEFHTVILGAEHLGDGYYGSYDLERLVGGSSDYGYTTVGIPADYNYVKFYATPDVAWSGSGFKQTINNTGGQYVHHVGHANTGTVAGWEVQDINDGSFAKLDGVTHNYNFFHSHGCVCGDFTHGCILERMVTISSGFVAVTGNSRYGWYQPWGDGMAAHLHREFIDAYYHDRLPYIGTAFVEMKIMTAPYAVDDPCMRWNLYDINILGDVAVCPWLDEPFYPMISYESAIPMGSTSTPITVTKEGVPQSNFRCSIFHDGELLAFGMTNAVGVTNIVFDEPLNVADTLTLIVTGPNAWPQTFSLIGLNNNEAFVYPQSVDIHGDFEFGKAISMDAAFINAGLVDANNVTATLSTPSEFVTLSKSTVTVGDLSAGQYVNINDAFDFTVAQNIPDDTKIDFVVTCTDGTHVWNRDLFFMSKAPNVVINDVTYEEVVGNMNGFIDAGETIRVTVSGVNKGHINAMNPILHGNINTDYISFINNDSPFESIEVSESFEETMDFVASMDMPYGLLLDLDMSVISGQYVSTKVIQFYSGSRMETFETGDFTQYPWRHWGNAEWFVTDTVSHTGSFSAQCGQIIKNQKTSLILDVEISTEGYMSFYYKTSTKYKKDYLIFYIDGKVGKYWSGENDWTFVSFKLTAGSHTLEWRYDTAANGGTEGNVCWIDDVVFPGNTIISDDVEEIATTTNVAVYPNPANDVVYVKGTDIQCVEVFNAVGMRVVCKDVNNSESIDLTGFASGIYFVRTFDNKGNITTTKLIKK